MLPQYSSPIRFQKANHWLRHGHVHVNLPSRQDARPPVPWRHPVEGADKHTMTTHRLAGAGVPPGKWPPKGGSLSLPARMYRGGPAAAAPRPFSMRMPPEPDSNVTPSARGTAHWLMLLPVQKDTGGSRDTHETDTRTSQTNLKTNPAHRLTRQTTTEPRDARTRRHTPHHSPDRARWW